MCLASLSVTANLPLLLLRAEGPAISQPRVKVPLRYKRAVSPF
jgi:hypothetical protein